MLNIWWSLGDYLISEYVGSVGRLGSLYGSPDMLDARLDLAAGHSPFVHLHVRLLQGRAPVTLCLPGHLTCQRELLLLAFRDASADMQASYVRWAGEQRERCL